jgi:hypothetical protein
MRYMLLISGDETVEPEVTTPDGMTVFREWLADLQRRGVLQVHEGLHASATATTVRVRGDEVLLTDGPFAESKDQVGGFAVVDCDDLDQAIEIAAGHPAARFGQVEIRPVREP